jgi:hypothetical protein
MKTHKMCSDFPLYEAMNSLLSGARRSYDMYSGLQVVLVIAELNVGSQRAM